MFNFKIFTRNNIFISNQILTQIIKSKLHRGEMHTNMQPIVMNNKSATIFNQYIGIVFLIYNGYQWSAVTVKPQMIGRKFGEFIFTKKIAKFAKKGERRRV